MSIMKDIGNPRDTLATITSSGRPFDLIDLRLVDQDGADVEIGDPGEVWCRGEAVTEEGYIGAPQATAEAYTSGWFRTGDLACMLDDKEDCRQGYIQLVGGTDCVIDDTQHSSSTQYLSVQK